MNTNKQLWTRVGVSILLLAIALSSILWLADLASSPERHAESIAALDEKKITVMELTSAAAVASVAVSAIPGDATTPIAEQIADLSSYLLLAVGAIMLEKILLTLTGYVTFTYLIPAACLLGFLSQFWAGPALRRLALKLVLFGLAICLVIPASLGVSNLVEDTFDVQQTVDQAALAAEEAGDSADEEDSGGWLSQLGEQILSGVSNVVEEAKGLMSRFIDAVAVLLIVNLAIPLLTLWFFLWLVKLILGLNITLPPLKSLRPGKRRQSAEAVVPVDSDQV